MRVLKPGGHLLAFGGSRTWHRLAVAIEDAGFEIRDSIAWLYGSGFPKSMDISKAIDKAAPRAGMFVDFSRHFAECRKSAGLTQKAIAVHFPSKTGGVTGCVWNWENGASVPTLEQWKILQPMLNLSNEWLPLIERIEAEREVIGLGAAQCQQLEKTGVCDGHFDNGTLTVKHQMATTPATDEAKQWAGWGTALKPAFEPVVVARKPLIGTVAENVLTWGVGGLNIDGSRIGINPGYKYRADANGTTFHGQQGERIKRTAQAKGSEFIESTQGRWPANIILDEYTAGLLDEQSGHLHGAGTRSKRPNRSPFTNGTDPLESSEVYDTGGGASRFFYVAKASKKDRNEGLDGLPDTKWELQGHQGNKSEDGIHNKAGTGTVAGFSKNFHPTVKPTNLMRYLIKLVTPPNGIVLDPFTGSGSTGKAALLNGFKFIGIELTEEYLPIIEGRLTYASQAKEEEESETLF